MHFSIQKTEEFHLKTFLMKQETSISKQINFRTKGTTPFNFKSSLTHSTTPTVPGT